MSLNDEVDDRLDRTQAPERVWAAVIASNAVDLQDRVSVTIPLLDTNLRWEDCRWVPHNDFQFPQRGDECVIVIDDNNELWIVSWWSDSVRETPAARAYHNAAQTINNAAETVLTFNTEVHDTDGIHSGGSRLTCKTAGKYHITVNCEFVPNGNGQRWVTIRKNAAAGTYNCIDRRPGHSTISTLLHASVDLDLNVNDYVEAVVYQDSTISLNVEAGGASIPFACQFMMHRI